MDVSALEQSSKILQAAKDQVVELLTADGQHMLVLGIEADISKLINRLAFVAGTNVAIATKSAQNTFPPVTKFMGEELKTPAKVEPAKIQPTPTAKEIFLQKVNSFQEQLPTLENEKVLDSYKTNEDQNVIRGVAKRAGLDDFKSAAIDGTYLDLIRAGLKELAEQAQIKADAEKKLKDEGTGQ